MKVSLKFSIFVDVQLGEEERLNQPPTRSIAREVRIHEPCRSLSSREFLYEAVLPWSLVIGQVIVP